MKHLSSTRLFACMAIVYGCLVVTADAQAQGRSNIRAKMAETGAGQPPRDMAAVTHELRLLNSERRFQRAVALGTASLKQFAAAGQGDESNPFGEGVQRAQFHQTLAISFLQSGETSKAVEQIVASISNNSNSALDLRSKLLEANRQLLQNPEQIPGFAEFARNSPEEFKKMKADMSAAARNAGSPTDSAVRRENAFRLLLAYNATDIYLAQVAKLQPTLEKEAKDDLSGACDDSLSMIALVRGDYATFQRCYEIATERKKTDKQARQRSDERQLLMGLLSDRPASISTQMRQHAETAINNNAQNPDAVAQDFIALAFGDDRGLMSAGSPARSLDAFDRSFLLSSMPSFASHSPTLSQTCCEIALLLKKDRSRWNRRYSDQWTERERIEAERSRLSSNQENAELNRFAAIQQSWEKTRELEDRRKIAQFASTCLLARPSSSLSAASEEAQWLIRSPIAPVPGRRPMFQQSGLSADANRVSLREIQRTLESHEAILEITVSDNLDLANLRKGLRWAPQRYVGWMIRRTGEPIFVDFGECAVVDQLVSRAHTGIGEGIQQVAKFGDAEALKEIQPALDELSRALLEPFTDPLKTVTKLTICPDASLWLVPWGSLGIGEGRLLIEHCEVEYAGTSAWRTEQKPPFKGTVTAPAVFADALFDASSKIVLDAEARLFHIAENSDPVVVPLNGGKSIFPQFPPLPGTAREAEMVAERLKTLCKLPPQVFTKTAALESVARSLKNPEMLVFAVHGFALPPFREGPTSRAVTGTKPATQNAVPSSRALDITSALPQGFQVLDMLVDPFVRCGIVLSGANNSDKWGEVRSADGILTGLEAALMDLRGTKLVVLSACETGLGDPTVGDGVAGLRQAFLMAGAEAVVASLWQVPDAATADLMSDFFTFLKNSDSPSQALRKAQLKQIEKRRELYGAAHPYYWAAFTVTGR